MCSSGPDEIVIVLWGYPARRIRCNHSQITARSAPDGMTVSPIALPRIATDGSAHCAVIKAHSVGLSRLPGCRLVLC